MNTENPENAGNMQEIRNDKGQFIKGVSGNPAGKPLGTPNKFSPTMQLQQIWEENPALFNEFVRKWANNPRNQQQIVEMLDGKPKGSDTNIAVAVQNITYSPEDRLAVAYELVAKSANISIDELKDKIK